MWSDAVISHTHKMRWCENPKSDTM